MTSIAVETGSASTRGKESKRRTDPARRFLPPSWAWCLWLLLLLFGCGGGGGEDTPDTPASFTVQPVSQSVVDGGSVTFTVTVSGTGVTLQWQRSVNGGAAWQDIAGAVAQAWTIAVVDAAMNGHQFRVAARSASSSTPVLSSAVTLSVTPPAPPAIVVQPAAASATAGTDATFAVTASGTSLVYQWETSANGVTYTDVAGANNATLALTGVPLADNGRRYRVRISNGGGSVTSVAVQLTVTPPPVAPVITAQPVTASVIAGQTATFTVSATGTPAPTYQWQTSTDGGTTFAAIAGATSASHTTAATQAGDNGKRYRVVLANAAGTVTSAAVVLTVGVGTVPVPTLNPADKYAYLPNGDFMSSTATFTATFSGTPTPTLQWQVSTDGGLTFANINGATNASYATPVVVTGDDDKRFRLVATNAAGTAATSAARLIVRNAGIGGEAAGLGVRANGEVLAAVNPFAPAFTVPNLSIPDFYGIRTVGTTGRVVTLAGSGTRGHADGTGAAASFFGLSGLVLDAAGNAYVTDLHSIRKITPTGVVTTLAGVWNQAGLVDDTGALARFNSPNGITIDAAGNLYVADTRNFAIRRVTPAGVVSTVAGNGGQGGTDGTGAAARFVWPLGVAVGAAGDVFVTDTFIQGVSYICLIRRVSPAGVTTTISGANGCALNGTVEGPLATALFWSSWGITADAAGNLYVAAPDNVRVISPVGIVSTLAGSNTGPRYNTNGAIAVDAGGNVYVHNGHPDHTVDNLVRKIAPGGTFTLMP